MKIYKRIISFFLVLFLFVGNLSLRFSVYAVSLGAGAKERDVTDNSGLSNPKRPQSADDAWEGCYVNFGTWNKAPLKWRVLNKTGAELLLMTDGSVGSYPYRHVDTYSTEVSENTWEKSTLRSWLNNEFIQNAFTADEQAVLKSNTVLNGNTASDNFDSGPDTYDKVYILSSKEFRNPDYGFWGGIEDAKSRVFGKDGSQYAEMVWTRTMAGMVQAYEEVGFYAHWINQKGGFSARGSWFTHAVTWDKDVHPVIKIPVSAVDGEVSEPDEPEIENALMLTSAMYKYGTKSVNLVNTAHSIETSHREFDLLCYIEDKSKAKRYELYSGGIKIADSIDGNFIDIKPSKFENGETVSVRVVGEEESVTTKLLLEIKEKKVPNISKLKLGGDALSFTLDESMPIFGGSEIKLNFPEVPVNAVIEDGKIKIGINIAKKELYSWDSNDGVTTSNKKKTMKQKVEGWVKDIKETGKINKHYQNYIENQLDADFPLMKEKVNFTVFGYLEGEFSDSLLNYEKLSGEIVVAVSGGDTIQSTILVLEVIPVTVNCKLSVEGAVDGTVILDLKDFSWSGSLDYDSSIGIEPFVGIGAGTYLSYGVYGNLKLGLEATLLSSLQSSGPDNLYFSGEFGTKAYFAKKEVSKHPIISSKKWKEGALGKYVNDKGQLLLYSRTEDNIYDDLISKKTKKLSEEYHLNMFNESEPVWSEEKNSVYLSSPHADVETQTVTLVQNAYGAAEPQIITAGNTTLIVYLDNDESRALPNQTVLKYVTYDAASEVFSNPKIILDDQTADFKPYLYTDGKDIYVYYLNSKKIYSDSEDPDISDYAGSFSITTAKYDAVSDSFTELGTLNRTDSYCYAPVLTNIGEELLLAWVENESNQVFGLTGDNSVNYSIYSDGQWSVPQCIAENLNSVTSLTAGNLSGNMQIAYCEDIDNSLSTEMLRMYLADTSGHITKVLQDSISNLQIVKLPGMEQNVLAFNDNGAVSYIRNADDEKKNLFGKKIMDIGSDFEVEGNRVYYLQASGENGRNIGCMVYENGEWGSIDFTSEKSYIDQFSASGGKTVYLVTEADLSGDDIITNSYIRFLKSDCKNDLSIDNVDFDEENLKLDSDISMLCTITNHGTNVVHNPIVTFYNKQSQIMLQQQTLNVSINPGSTIQRDVNLKIPSTLENLVCELRIEETDKTDSNMEDNSVDVDLSKTELDVSTEYRIVKEGKYIVVNVANNSNVPAVADITVTKPNGDIVFSEDNQTIPANKSIEFQTAVNDVIPDGAADIVLTASAKTTADEYYQSNNICEQRIWKIDWSEPIVTKNENKIQNIILTDVSMNKDSSLQLKAQIFPENATNKELKWFSNNEQVATVDSNGLVTAVGTGKATITVESQDGSGKSASCVVTVTKISNDNTSGNNPSDGSSGSNPSGNTPGNNTSGSKPGDNIPDEKLGDDSCDELQVKLLYYIVNFDSNGGTNLSRKTMTLLMDDTLGILPKVQRKNYTFKGWYMQKSGGEKVDTSTILNASTTLYAQWTKIAKPAKVKSLALKSTKSGQLKVSYKKVTGAAGYQIVYSANKKFTSSSTKKILTVSKNKTLKKLKTGRKYYIRVRAYKTGAMGEKIYGSYSKIKTIKIK